MGMRTTGREYGYRRHRELLKKSGDNIDSEREGKVHSFGSSVSLICLFSNRVSILIFPDTTEERLPALVFRFNKNGLTSAASTPAVSSLATSDDSSAKRKYEKSTGSIPRATTPPPIVNRNQEKEKEREREKERREALERKMKKEEEEEEEVEDVKPKQELSKLKDWKSLIPSMDELRIRAERAEQETKKVVDATSGETKKDPTRVQLVKNFRRPILILPYLENPTGPDFLLHK